MNFSHRNRGGKEARDIWIRAFPLQSLNQIILSSLSKSQAGSKLQLVRVAKFILTEITDLQNFNEECIQKRVPEFVDTEEFNRYLSMFDEIFVRIVSDTDWTCCESKTELIELVTRYDEEGRINFKNTRVPEMLLKTISPDRLQDTLLEALIHSGDEMRMTGLIQICSPGNPENFKVVMKSLLQIFLRSDYHPNVMSFARKFVIKLEESHGKKFMGLVPTYFHPIVVIYLECLPLLGDRNCSGTLLRELVLWSLEDVYNPGRMKLGDLTEEEVSFYVASACPKFCPILEEAVKDGEVSFKGYPFLWMHLQDVKRIGSRLKDQKMESS